MNNPGARNILQFGISIKEPVEKRARVVARTGMHDESGGLFNDDDRLVFVDHLELDPFLGLEMKRFIKARRLKEPHLVAFCNLEADLVDDLAVHLDLAVLNQLLKTRARYVRQHRRHHFVEAFAPKTCYGKCRKRLFAIGSLVDILVVGIIELAF